MNGIQYLDFVMSLPLIALTVLLLAVTYRVIKGEK